MNSEALWELVKVFLAALFASALTHLLTHRRFIQGRWWDRKAHAYENIIGDLADMVCLLRRHLAMHEYELPDLSGPDVHEHECEWPNVRERGALIFLDEEYFNCRRRLERVVFEGDYVISERASSALLELIQRHSDWCVPSDISVVDYLRKRCAEMVSCLEIVPDEAKSDLRVKWYSW